MQLKVSYEDRSDGVTVVRVESEGREGGALNADSAPELRALLVRLAEEGRLLLVVDLAAMDGIDSRGLAVLVGALKRVHVKGGTLSLVLADGRIRDVLAQTGLTKVFRLHRTASDAVQTLVADYGEEGVEERRAAREEAARERRARRAAGAAARVAWSEAYTFEHVSDSVTLVQVLEELDVYTCPRLRELLVDLVNQGRYFLAVDLTACDYLDSTGVGVLVGALKRLRAHEGALALVVPSERLLKQFRITGLAQVFRIFPSVDPAVEFLGRRALGVHV